jgi:drug/metabolite transporter (DMT)-like permease
MHSAVSGQIPPRMRQFLIAVGVLLLAGAGQAASAPSPAPTISGVLAGLAALCLGAVMAFCGAHFALRRA